MKGKAGSAMPSFLLSELNGSEEEESDNEVKVRKILNFPAKNFKNFEFFPPKLNP